MSGDTSLVSEKPAVTEDEAGGSKKVSWSMGTIEATTAGCQSKTSIDLWPELSCCFWRFEEDSRCSSIVKILHLVDTLKLSLFPSPLKSSTF